MDAQNSFPRSFDLLIDALRDCLDFLAANRQKDASAFITRLETSDVPLLRRLAVYGWQIRSDQTPDDKIDHLIESGELFAFATRREVYRLIETTAREADAARPRILDAIRAGVPTDLSIGGDHDERMAFDLLAWLRDCVPDDEAVSAEVEAMQADNPSLRPAEHPGYDRWTESHFGTTSPVSSEELKARHTIADIENLLEEHEAADPNTFFAWTFRIPQVVSASANEDPDWTIDLLSDLLSHRAWDHPFWSPLFEGLGRVDGLSDSEQAGRVFGLLADVLGLVGTDPTAAVILPFASDFLLALVRVPEVDAPTLDRVEDLGIRLSTLVASGPDGTVSDEAERVFDRGFNHWTGRTIRFWVDVIRRRWVLAGQDWQGLAPAIRSTLESLLHLKEPKSVYTRAIAAGYFSFFVGADEAWTLEHLLPLFDWVNESLAARSWSAFLEGGETNDHVVALLLDSLSEAFERVAGELGFSLARWFAAAVVRSSLDLYEDGVVAKFITNRDEEDRQLFAETIGWLLHAMPPEYTERQWTRWIKQYLEDRIASRPLPFAPDEAGAMLRWVTMSGNEFPEAVRLFCQSGARFTQIYVFSTDVKDRNLIDQFPRDTTLLIEFVLSRTAPGWFFDCSGVGELMYRLIPVAGTDFRSHLLSICEAAAGLYCADAAEWRELVTVAYPDASTELE